MKDNVELIHTLAFCGLALSLYMALKATEALTRQDFGGEKVRGVPKCPGVLDQLQDGGCIMFP